MHTRVLGVNQKEASKRPGLKIQRPGLPPETLRKHSLEFQAWLETTSSARRPPLRLEVL